MKKFLILVSIGVLAACASNQAANNANVRTANASPSAAVNAAPNMNAPTANASPTNQTVNAKEKAKIRLFNGKGAVTKINLEIVSVELDHEAIEGLMPKMTMEFYVKEKAELEKLKVGDAVDFVLEDNAGAERIVSIKKSK